MMPSPQTPRADHTNLVGVCHELLGDRHLIVAGNRGPIEYVVAPDSELRALRSHGGLVTGLGSISQSAKLTWVASAMGDADRRAAHLTAGGRIPAPLLGQNLAVHFVVCNRNTYHKYYNVISNPLLWFLQHYMWNSPYTPNIDANTFDAWENGYVAVNRAFADSIIAEMARADTAPVAMLHDYQLYLVAKMVREAVPEALLQHFVHIPWPSSGAWLVLPAVLRCGILEGLLANDVVGFQTERSVRDFLHTVEAFLPTANIDPRSRTIRYRGRTTHLRAYPIAVDVPGLLRTATSPRVREYQERIHGRCGERTIVRVDRVDPSRNIVRGFRAYETLLERYPDYVGKVKFLAFLTPSRTRVREYQRYGDELMATVNAVNSRFGDPDWQPITLFMENNYLQSIAGLRLYDVLLINAVVDGMNLVAKEGPIVNQRDGVVILSEGTGAYEQLHEAVLEVAPTDLEGTVQALHRALSMLPEERQARAETLRGLIEKDDVATWLHRQFTDLASALRERDLRAPIADPTPRELPVQ